METYLKNTSSSIWTNLFIKANDEDNKIKMIPNLQAGSHMKIHVPSGLTLSDNVFV